jgi:hypothetical protein
MLPTYVIAVDAHRDLVHVTLSGFFEVDQVMAFGAALVESHRELRCPPNMHLSLIDCTDIKIQSQAVVAAFTALVRDSRTRSRRAAMIVGTSLARGQARRVYPADHDRVALFPTRAAAEDWLFAPPVSVARTAFRYPHVPASPRSAARGYTAPNGA